MNDELYGKIDGYRNKYHTGKNKKIGKQNFIPTLLNGESEIYFSQQYIQRYGP